MYSLTIVFSLLIGFVTCANILGVFWIPSFSHQIVFQPIWKELSLRGHQVTVITPNPLNDPSLVNLTEIDVSSVYDYWKNMVEEGSSATDINIFALFFFLYKFFEGVADLELATPAVKELINDKDKEFDLILIEFFHPVMYGIAGRFKAPTITVSSLGVPIVTHDVVGNPAHPVLSPDLFLNFHEEELSVLQKLKSTAYALWCRFLYHYLVLPGAHSLAKKHFGDDIPYVGDIERNTSLLFMNTNPLLYSPRPLVPSVIQLGQMHIREPQPLPHDSQDLLDEAKEGVIYFSLGTNVKSLHVTEALRNVIIGALAELPYKVLWKFESDHFTDKPDNVIIRQWLPQQDILAHSNIKAFVTQGGLQSTEEAISRKIPLIGMPFFGDQPMNVKKIVSLGIGVGVNPNTVTKDELRNAILEVVQNSKYKNKIREMNDILFDKPMSGLENAVWWTEYVIRHKGAKHLRSPSADISWFHYLLLDVILAALTAAFIFVYLCRKFMKCLKTQRKTKLKNN